MEDNRKYDIGEWVITKGGTKTQEPFIIQYISCG